MAIYERMTIRGRGGALPTYQRQTGAYAPGAGVSVRMDDSAARIASAGDDLEARALIRLGDTMNKAVRVGVKAYDDYSKSKATQLITRYRRDMNMALYGENGILTQKGEAALDADEQRAERARQLRDELMKDAGEYTRHYFTLLADDYDADTSLKAQRYAGKERVTMMNRNDEAAAEERAENAIASYANENDFNKSLGESLWYMEQRLRRDGYSDEALRRGLKETSSKVFRGAIENALAGNDVASARRLLERGSRMSSGSLPHDLSKAEGLVESGNIDLDHRPMVKTEDGGTATVRSMSVNFDGKEVLIPTVSEDGRLLSDDEAIQLYMRTGKHLGKFSTPEAATDYAQKLHENQEVQYLGQKKSYMTADDVAWGKNAIRTKQEALQAKAEAAAKRREEEAEKAFVQGTSASIIAQLDQFPADWTTEQKEAKLVQLTADIEDPKQRRAVRSLVKADLDDKELVRKAGVVEELGQIDRTFEQNPNMTPTERLAMIRTGNFSDETKKTAEKSIMDAMEGKDNTAHSAAGLTAYRRWFDAMGGNVTADQEKAMMLDLGLNSKDRQAAEEYKGARLEYPQQHVFALIDSVKGKGKVNETGKNRIYDAVIQEAKARGKALTDKEIKAIIFKQDVEGYVAGSEPGWFGRRPSMTYGEALRKSGGSMGLFRPEVPEDTATQIKVRLEMEKPWTTLLSEDMRDALVQTVYLQEQFGIPLALSAEENKAFKAAMDAYNKRTNR